MTQHSKLICDACGAEIPRSGHEIPNEWMHITAWYRPMEDKNGFSGCTDIDLCSACMQRSSLGLLLHDRAMLDYNASMIKAEERR